MAETERETKQVVVELRLRFHIAADEDKDVAARRLFRQFRGKLADQLLDMLRIVEVEVENPFGLNIDLDGWKYRGFTDEE